MTGDIVKAPIVTGSLRVNVPAAQREQRELVYLLILSGNSSEAGLAGGAGAGAVEESIKDGADEELVGFVIGAYLLPGALRGAVSREASQEGGMNGPSGGLR